MSVYYRASPEFAPDRSRTMIWWASLQRIWKRPESNYRPCPRRRSSQIQIDSHRRRRRRRRVGFQSTWALSLFRAAERPPDTLLRRCGTGFCTREPHFGTSNRNYLLEGKDAKGLLTVQLLIHVNVGGPLISLSWLVGGKTTEVCNAWPVQYLTYDYLPCRRAPHGIDRYQIIQLGKRARIYQRLA